jgi:DNA-binding response OmpR family regulator
MNLQVLVYTRDAEFGGMVKKALSDTGATVFVARTVAEALDVVCQRGPNLTFALMDFDGGCRGMTLLSAVHTCYEHLPIAVTTSKDAEHVTAVAYANGARQCLPKPAEASTLAGAIAKLHVPRSQLLAA